MKTIAFHRLMSLSMALCIAGQASAQQAKAPAPQPAAATPSPTASRLLGDKLEEFIETTSNNLAIRKRETDCFGKSQEIKVVKQTSTATTAAAPSGPSGPSLNDVVANIKVTTVIASERKFLVGTRTFQVGEQLPIKYEGTQYNVVIMEVTTQRIVFRETTTNELGIKNMENMFQGIDRGSNSPSAPGMQKASQPEALNLDGSSNEATPPRSRR